MSGPGKVQRTIIDTLDAEPKWRFTVADMAARVYPNKAIGSVELKATHRALIKLAPALNIHKCRVGTPGSLGWHHVWGKR